jgi:hypothetical protein
MAAALLMLACWQAQAIWTFDPAREWYTLETPHFRFHFHTDVEDVARRAATLAERVHAELAPEFDWRPRDRTEVVVTDDFDLPNGFAVTIPYNLMVLFVVPPEPGTQLEVDSLDQWLEDLVVHEYTHVLHLDKATGAPLRLRQVFGRNLLTFPNLLQPIWLIEGLATHQETDHARGVGRGQGSAFDMILRTEVAEGVRPLAQVSVPNVSWPAGITPYVYGVHFYQFLASRYDDETIARFIDQYSGNLIPYRLNATAQRAFGVDMRGLWQEYERYLEDRYSTELDALRNDGIVGGVALTTGGSAGLQQGGNLQAMPDGGVYFVSDDGKRRSALVHRTRDGSMSTIARLNRGARFSVHPQAGIVVAQPEVCREYRTYYDLYLIRHGERRMRRLTHCSRYRDVAWHPDGRRLAAIRIDNGRSHLDLLAADGSQLQSMAASGADSLLAQPDWSPDGERMVLVRTARGRGGNLFEFVPASGEWRQLTAERHFASHPRYTPDGDAVLFTSDHGGVFNVRRLSLADGELETLTHVDTGAFQGHQGAPDGDVHFLRYGPQGYDLHVLTDPDGRRTPAARVLPDPEPAIQPWALGAARRYTPWHTLRPRSWLPYIELESRLREVGIFTFGRDALGRHAYFVQTAIDVNRGDLVGSAYYQWRDRLSVSVNRRHFILADDAGVRRNDTAGVTWRLPVTRLDRAWSMQLGASRDHEYDHVRPADALPFAEWRDDVVSAGLLYRDSLFHRLSISEQDGRRARLVAEHSVGASIFSGSVIVLDWREYFTVRDNQVLAARYAIGWGTDRPRPFRLGGSDTDTDAVFNRRRYSLRGYQSGGVGLIGRRMELASLEYRFPIALVERGLLLPPVGLHRWSGQVFAEAGRAWDRSRPTRWHASAGAEAVLDVTMLGWLGMRARMGYAHGFDAGAGGGNQFYLSMGTTF